MGDQVTLVVLMVGSERYALDVRLVREIQTAGRIARVPGVPSEWVGLVNVRGHLFPVLDLGAYLGLETGAAGANGKVVIVSILGLDVGLLCDDVAGVQVLPRADVGSPLSETLGVKREILHGLTSEMVSVLDLSVLFQDPRLVLHDDCN